MGSSLRQPRRDIGSGGFCGPKQAQPWAHPRRGTDTGVVRALHTYRHAPNTGSRKTWAAGDATARAVQHALMAVKGEMGYPCALSAPKWGFSDVLFRGQPVKLARPFGSYVMENVLFKISFPAEFHAQTAV